MWLSQYLLQRSPRYFIQLSCRQQNTTLSIRHFTQLLTYYSPVCYSSSYSSQALALQRTNIFFQFQFKRQSIQAFLTLASPTYTKLLRTCLTSNQLCFPLCIVGNALYADSDSFRYCTYQEDRVVKLNAFNSVIGIVSVKVCCSQEIVCFSTMLSNTVTGYLDLNTGGNNMPSLLGKCRYIVQLVF